MENNYQEPQFEVVNQDEENKVFYASSGTGFSGGGFNSMTSTSGAW